MADMTRALRAEGPMEDVTRVLREVQLNTEGRVVAARNKDGARDKDGASFIGVPKAPGLASRKKAGMVKAASSSDLDLGTSGVAGSKTASGTAPGPKEEHKAVPAVSLISKERVPQSFIDRIKAHPTRKLPPLSEGETVLFKEFFPEKPEIIARELENIIRINYLVDLEQDCLRQYNKKGYAEVGVDFTKGMKQLFILPQEEE